MSLTLLISLTSQIGDKRHGNYEFKLNAFVGIVIVNNFENKCIYQEYYWKLG